MTTVAEPWTAITVAEQFTSEPIVTINSITDGSINETYEVVLASGDRFILQAMSPIFAPVVLENLQAIQPYVQAAGVMVPECLPARDGALYVNSRPGRWYRALSFIPGKTIHDGLTVAGAESAGKLIGSFHTALADCPVEIEQPIKYFHDTAYYMERLENVQYKSSDSEKYATLTTLRTEILERYELQKNGMNTLPSRIIHADLKVSNIRFDADLNALALIDMDTLMHSTIQVELGDALRSWCGTAGEDKAEQVFDIAVYNAALKGYTETATAMTHAEIASIPAGIRLLTLELAARFLVDAFEETYFAKSSHYPSLFVQNKTRTQNQLHFLDAFEASGVL